MANKWLVLVGAFVTIVLAFGTVMAFSILFIPITIALNLTAGQLGFYIGLSRGITVAFGICTNVLLRKYTPRSLVMLGGFVGSLSLSACSFVQNGPQLCVCLTITGFAYGLVFLPTLASVVYAFGETYELPFTIALTGGGVGIMLVPLLIEFFIDKFGWRGAIFLLGAINLHKMAAGALFTRTSIRQRSPPQPRPATEMDRLVVDEQSVTSESSSTYSSPTSTSIFCCDPECDCDCGGSLCRCFVGLHVDISYPLLLYSILAGFLHGVTCDSWTIFLFSNAEFKGVSADVAVFLSLAAGIANIGGRIITTYLPKYSKTVFNPRSQFIAFGVIGGMAFCLNIVAFNYESLVVLALMNALAIGAKTVLNSLISVNLVPPRFRQTVLSLSLFAVGSGRLLGCWLTGYVFDITRSFNKAFLFLGCVDFAGAILLTIGFIHQAAFNIEISNRDP